MDVFCSLRAASLKSAMTIKHLSYLLKELYELNLCQVLKISEHLTRHTEDTVTDEAGGCVIMCVTADIMEISDILI